jgi:hypothetical protein
MGLLDRLRLRRRDPGAGSRASEPAIGAGRRARTAPGLEVGPGYRHARFGGCSSFHLWWGPVGRSSGEHLVEVAATLEVLVEPVVDPTYFWALQATFADDRRTYGGAHIGLQSYSRFPDRRAVNWGGYADPPAGGVLAGTTPALPGFDDDPNTRAYPWSAGTPYRFRIFRGPVGWAGEVTDLASGRAVVLRELLADGDRLQSPVVWAEVFAPCESPGTTVRWSNLSAVTADGDTVRPDRVRLTFPDRGDCPNTDVTIDRAGVQQMTGVHRTARDGAVLALPR